MPFPRPTDLPLYHLPHAAWERTWKRLLAGNGFAKQLHRNQNLKANIDYVRANAPELSRIRDRVVLELSQGPGELLEIGRFLGHIGFGIMPPVTDVYGELCQMLHVRQGLDVAYDGLAAYLTAGRQQNALIDRLGGRCQLINCRELLAQLPLDTDRQTGETFVDLEAATSFCSLMHALLCSSGILLTTFGSAKGRRASETILREIARENGLQLARSEDRIYKWRKI
jgi:hypothetical protein